MLNGTAIYRTTFGNCFLCTPLFSNWNLKWPFGDIHYIETFWENGTIPQIPWIVIKNLQNHSASYSFHLNNLFAVFVGQEWVTFLSLVLPVSENLLRPSTAANVLQAPGADSQLCTLKQNLAWHNLAYILCHAYLWYGIYFVCTLGCKVYKPVACNWN